MRKKIGTLLIIGSLGALCAGLAACSNDTPVDDYFKKGSVITVTYDASGGEIAGGTNVKLMDMFNPDKFTADENGIVEFKLRNPTDPARPKPGVDNVKVTKEGHSLVGWYKVREVDESGNYTYKDPWDFATDKVKFNKNEQTKLDMTLYAAWIPQYTFEYYYKATADGEWTKFGTTGFNYLAENKVDNLYVPDWSSETGKMDYQNNEVGFTFPSLDKMTFKAAYSDESCSLESKITEPFHHNGELDRDTAKAINPVQKIYVEFDEGSRYRISTAKQFADIGDLAGQYTVLNAELDFKEVSWPGRFLSEEFNGKIISESGEALTFKNVNAEYYVESGAAFGGLFGKVGKDAELKNISFENATLTYTRAVSLNGGSFGFFAGEIDNEAAVENISISGKMQIFKLRVSGGEGFKFNLTANGDKRSAITDGGITIWACGEEITYGRYKDQFEFDINPDEELTVDKDGNITLTLLEDSNQDDKRKLRMRDYKEKIVYGGQEK